MKETDLHFALFPAGGEETASSRIRVYTFQRALAKRGIQATLGYSPGTNVLFIQKRVTPGILWRARIAKMMGSVILYDVDDLGNALWYWVRKSLFVRILALADVVSTSTDSQLNILTAQYRLGRIVVVPPTIDYYPTGPVRLQPAERDRLRIIWYGSCSNLHLFERYIGAILSIPQVDVVAVTSKEVLGDYSLRYPSVEFVPWSLSDFVPVLQTCDLSCLMHDGSPEDRAKSNNKMITSISWGVPAIVSRTPAYEQTAQEAGVEYAIFSDESELQVVVERLRSPEARSRYLDLSQPMIWNRYAPDVIAQQYVQLALEAHNTFASPNRFVRIVASFFPLHVSKGDA